MSYILGGLLTGLGKGMTASALQDREDALEKLKNQRTIETEGRTDERLIAAEGRAEERSIASDERQYGIKKGLLVTGGEIKKDQSKTDLENKKDLETHKGGIDERLARVKSVLDTNRDAASIRLRDELESGNIDDVIIDSAGNYVKLYKDGRTEVTDIAAAPTASQQKANDEAEAEYQREVRRAERRGEPIPERKGTAASARPAAKPKAAPVAANKISAGELSQMYNDASAMAARGEAPFKGLNAAQIKAKVDQLAKARGLQLP
tara:strand:- start:27748 stop:28539 length:792 start_codon:yes stop_codon:yes gene_type:complete